MDAIAALRRQARARRDAALAIARAEYRDALKSVRFFAADGDEPQYGPLDSLIVELIPPHPFGVCEMVVWLREVAPDRTINVNTIRQRLASLTRKGVLRRIGDDDENWGIWIGAEHEPTPSIHRLGIVDAMRLVLEEVGQLRAVELTIVLQDRGYRRNRRDRELYAMVYGALMRNARLFRQDAEGRWSMTSADYLGSQSAGSSNRPGCSG